MNRRVQLYAELVSIDPFGKTRFSIAALQPFQLGQAARAPQGTCKPFWREDSVDIEIRKKFLSRRSR